MGKKKSALSLGDILVGVGFLGGAAFVGYKLLTAPTAPTKAEWDRIQYLYASACTALDIANPPELIWDGVSNAAYDPHGNRVIVNIAWFRAMLEKYCDDEQCALSVVTGILGHELGHSFQREQLLATARRRSKEQSHAFELEADTRAGFVLGRIGLPSTDLEHVIEHMSGIYDSDTHPAGPDRAQAISSGFWRGHVGREV